MIESSVIKHIEVLNNNLIVKLKSGITYSYIGAAKEYSKFINSDSLGLYFNFHIKKEYDYYRVE